MYVYIKKENTI